MTYMDDLIVPSIGYEDGLRQLKRVLNVAADHGLTINWEKCRFLQTRLEYLGYDIEMGTIRPSERKLLAVQRFKEPKCVRDVQSFLGLTGYFRKFIERYSLIARPLTDLTRNDIAFEFAEKERSAFSQLKLLLTSKPVLRMYCPTFETELHTDASSLGFGAILMQRDSEDRGFHPVYFASGKTSLAEEKYHSYELEVLAVVRALKKFRVYLIGISFKIVTDCQAFVMTLKKKDACMRVARWALMLQDFDYVIEHQPGKSMRHVDALSRQPLPTVMLVQEEEAGIVCKLRQAQTNDKELQQDVRKEGRTSTNGYIMNDGLVCKQVNGELVIVVPGSLQTSIIRSVHERGHFAVGKTEQLLRRDYWFNGMRPKVEHVVRNCINCILAERKNGKMEGWLHPIPKGGLPLDTYHIDHLGPLPSTKKAYKFIFVVIDAFTKFVWLHPTKSTTTAEVIDRLEKQSMTFGNPGRIVSDRESAFTSTQFAEYCREQDIGHVKIVTGIPRGNGQVERVNRTLIPLLTKLAAPEPGHWHKYIGCAQRYLNHVPSRSTGVTPFHLLVGTRMRLKDDPMIKEIMENEAVTAFQTTRDQTREQARVAITKVQQENRRTYDKRRKEPARFKLNELVAIRRTHMGPGQKFCTKFLGPYRVSKTLRSDRYLVDKVGEHEGPRSTSTSIDYMKPWVDDREHDLSIDSETENI